MIYTVIYDVIYVKYDMYVIKMTIFRDQSNSIVGRVFALSAVDLV